MIDTCEICGRENARTLLYKIPAHRSSTGAPYTIRLCASCSLLPTPREDRHG